MGEFFLMIVLAIIIGGGAPALAFAYINGKIGGKAHTTKEARSRKAMRTLAFVLGVFFGCFSFPILNFTKDAPNFTRWYSTYMIVVEYLVIGWVLTGAFPYQKEAEGKQLVSLVCFNCVTILVGMGCRYLMEFGEVSNTYNFTAMNIFFHVIVTNLFYVLGWRITRNLPRERQGK